MGSIENMEPVHLDSSEYLKSNSRPLADHCGWNRTDPTTGYEILERPYGLKRSIKIIHIGAGASGINLAHYAHDYPGVEVQIYDKNPEVGGTWYENRFVRSLYEGRTPANHVSPDILDVPVIFLPWHTNSSGHPTQIGLITMRLPKKFGLT